MSENLHPQFQPPFKTGNKTVDESLRLLHSCYSRGIIAFDEYIAEAKEQYQQLQISKNASVDKHHDDLTKTHSKNQKAQQKMNFSKSRHMASISEDSISLTARSETKAVLQNCSPKDNSEALSSSNAILETSDTLIKPMNQGVVQSITEQTYNLNIRHVKHQKEEQKVLLDDSNSGCIHSKIYSAATIHLSEHKKLRSYQSKLISAFLQQLEKGVKSVLLYMPTGAGKTILSVAIMKAYYLEKKRILFVVDRNELVRQTERTLLECGLSDRFGFVKSGYEENRTKRIQIASIQTLRQSKRMLPVADIVIIDEAHHCLSPSYVDLIRAYEKSIVLGLSATPFRTKETEDLSQVFETCLVGPSIASLIEYGVLVPPVVFSSLQTENQVSRCVSNPKTTIDWEACVKKDGAIKDTIKEWMRLCEGKRTLVFCIDRQHARRVATLFQAAGVPAAYIDGTIASLERNRVLSDFRKKSIQVISSVNVLSEGFDEPAIEALILLRPTKSKTTYVQQIGRGLRCFEGKSNCIVLDEVGNTWRHGMATALSNTISRSKMQTLDVFPDKACIKRCTKCGHLRSNLTETCQFCDASDQSVQTLDSDIDELAAQFSRTSVNTCSNRRKCIFQAAEETTIESELKKYDIPTFKVEDGKNSTEKKFLKNIQNLLLSKHPLSAEEVMKIKSIVTGSTGEKNQVDQVNRNKALETRGIKK